MLRFGANARPAALERIGHGDRDATTARAVVRVPQIELREAVAHLLRPPTVTDLTVEDPPLEEVMRELFARP